MPKPTRSPAELVELFCPRSVPPEAAAFAREVTRTAGPLARSRTKAFLFATSRLAAFGLSVGAELSPEVLLDAYFVDRFVLVVAKQVAPSTLRTLRTNLEAVRHLALPASGPRRVELARHRAKSGYTAAEIDAYVANALAQSTEGRQMKAVGLIALGAGAGLTGSDLRSVRGTDVIDRAGGLLVEVHGSHPRTVPVLARYHDLARTAASYARSGFIVGGREQARRNVTGPLLSATAAIGLERLDISRLRATWLAECASRIGLAAFMAAAGVSCSQRLGDIVAGLDPGGEQAAVALFG